MPIRSIWTKITRLLDCSKGLALQGLVSKLSTDILLPKTCNFYETIYSICIKKFRVDGGYMTKKCSINMTIETNNAFALLCNSIFAYIKKLRFPLVKFDYELQENPVLGSLFMFVN